MDLSHQEHEMGITHVTPADGNIFADLGFAPAEAETLRIRSELMIAIHKTIDDRELTKKDAAKLFGVTQARITALRRGEIDAFTSDELFAMLAHAGMHVEVNVNAAA
jgi:predicted XRE-type DNA-binding protein